MIRKHKLTSIEITILGIVGACVIGISSFSLENKNVKDHDLLLRTASKTAEAFSVLKKARLEKNIPIDSVNDPAESGLIGAPSSEITSSVGDLESNLTSINPNWSAVVINYLKKAGVRPGDRVALSMTGSIPAFNIATLIAIQEYGAKPEWIVANSSSNWGANIADFSWLDMEKILYDNKILTHRAKAASLGGENDNGAGLSSLGRDSLRAIISRNEIPLFEGGSLDSSIKAGMTILKKSLGNKKPSLFISLGNGIASIGTRDVGSILKNGINYPKKLIEIENQPVLGYVARFLKEGVPVLCLTDILKLAENTEQPVAPAITPVPGAGSFFSAPRYNPLINIILLIAFIGVIAAVSLGLLDSFFKNPRKDISI
jgi:poly-gamma-glutamate system protein